MTLVAVRRHRRALAAQDVRRKMIIPDELVAVVLVVVCHHLEEIDIDRVGGAVLDRARRGGDLHVGHARNRRRRFAGGIHRNVTGIAHFEINRRSGADIFQREDMAEGHIDHEALGGDEGLLRHAVDRHLDGAVIDEEDHAVVGIEHRLGFLAGAQRLVVGVLVLVADDRLDPVGLAAMRRQDVLDAPDGLVRRGVLRQRGRLGRPDFAGHAAAIRHLVFGAFSEKLGRSRNAEHQRGGGGKKSETGLQGHRHSPKRIDLRPLKARFGRNASTAPPPMDSGTLAIPTA